MSSTHEKVNNNVTPSVINAYNDKRIVKNRSRIRAALLSAAKSQFREQQQSRRSQDQTSNELIQSTLISKSSSSLPSSSNTVLAAPISPSPTDLIYRILPELNLNQDSVLIDFGVGDGRWVIAASHEFKCNCIGYDIDKERIQKAKVNIQQHEQLHNTKLKVSIYERDVFDLMRDTKANNEVRKADVLIFYLFREALIQMSALLKHKGILPFIKQDRSDQTICDDTQNDHDHVFKTIEIVSVGFVLPDWSSPTWSDKCCGLNVYIYEAFLSI